METRSRQFGEPGRLPRQLEFIIEIDRLKGILRQTRVLGGERRENSAEHSWHLAVMALLLGEYAAEPVDLLRVGDVAAACGQLEQALRRTDGSSRPPDFAAGESAEVLADMIREVMDELGCS